MSSSGRDTCQDYLDCCIPPPTYLSQAMIFLDVLTTNSGPPSDGRAQALNCTWAFQCQPPESHRLAVVKPSIPATSCICPAADKGHFLQCPNIQHISLALHSGYSRRWRHMFSAESKSNRSWQEIAAAASQEQDSKKLVELVEELEHALEARDAEMRAGSKPAHRAAK